MQHLNFYHFITLLLSVFTTFSAMAGPGEDFRSLVFEETEYFVLEKVDFDKKNMFLRADYSYKPLNKKVSLLLQYGENDVIAEEIRVRSSTSKQATVRVRPTGIPALFKMHHAIDKSAIKEVLSRSEMRDIYDRFKELYNYKGYIEWQQQHGSLLDEHPVTEVFPLEYKSFSIRGFKLDRGEFKASYRTPETGGYPSITLLAGEAARQYGQRELCGDPEKIDINGTTFYPREGKRSYSLLTRLDKVFITIGYRYGDDPDKQAIQEKTVNLAQGLDLERIRNFDYPRIEGPGNGLQQVEIDAGEFAPFFPEKSGDLTLQKVHSYPEAMHIRADYLYEPENHKVSLHMAYGDYRDRLKTGLRGPSVGNFRVAYETGCLHEKIDREEIRQVTSSIPVPDEADIVQWEMQNLDYTAVNSLSGYFPASFGKFTVESFNPDDDELEVKSKYAFAGSEKPISFNVVYGKEAAKNYNRYQFAAFEKEEQLRTIDIGALAFEVVDLEKRVLATHYHDQLLITVMMVKPENKNASTDIIDDMEDFLVGFDAEQFADWEAPENYEEAFDDTTDDGTKICLSPKCMDEYLSKCKPAVFAGRLNYSLGVMYKIEEARGDRCRISMTYTRNPNDEWENKPLYFYLEPGESFKNGAKKKIKECLEGNGSNCEGPLLDVINQQ